MAGILNKLKDIGANAAEGWARVLDLPIYTKPSRSVQVDRGPSTISQEVSLQRGKPLLPGMTGDYIRYNNAGSAFPNLQGTNDNPLQAGYSTLQGSLNIAVPQTIQRTKPSSRLMNQTWSAQPSRLYRPSDLTPHQIDRLPDSRFSVIDYLDLI